MLSAGKNIKQKNDPLQKLDLQRLFLGITKPKTEIKEFIEQLRILKSIDPKAYRLQKTKLPYVVPALFNPMFRKTENFNSILHVILDLDHIADHYFEVEELKNKLKTDETIQLLFMSPGGDGLKLFFTLNEPCFDHQKFSLFYHSFAQKFANKHNIKMLVDFSTSDVTRACFVSIDYEAYFNLDAEKIDIEQFIDYDDIFEVNKFKNEIVEIKKEAEKNDVKQEINKDVFIELKSKLNPKIKLREERQKHIFVPEKLDEIIALIQEFVVQFELNIDEIKNINYGKKFCFSHKHHTAEINVFYGKKGFSVVRSPKSGTNLELMEIGVKVFTEFFANYSKLNRV
ncbi:MAG: virulence protein E [Bacteroidales bacterium]|nr:virulence protein E [Bacteroidales bacterium]